MAVVQRIPKTLIVVPCLNEAAHIGALLKALSAATRHLNALIVVADGGSSDGTLAEVAAVSSEPDRRIVLIDNPKKLQSAGINLAVEKFGDGCKYLIRIDAHGGYPNDYCEVLIGQAETMGADSVVVSMHTVGCTIVQSAAAAAQNSKLGTGGAKHRRQAEGQWIEHGHHALMRIAAFKAVGGYDEAFSHNEDAELDYRLTSAGYRIWLTGKTTMTYYPRSSFSALFTQYERYGRGRALNLFKHRVVPKIRQALPLLVMPSALLVCLAPLVGPVALLPVSCWIAVCLGYGLWLALRDNNPNLVLAGLSAMTMHFAWSTGFWFQFAISIINRKSAI